MLDKAFGENFILRVSFNLMPTNLGHIAPALGLFWGWALQLTSIPARHN